VSADSTTIGNIVGGHRPPLQLLLVVLTRFDGEAFNVTNSLIKMDPGVNLNSNTF
jgi:hypothetical protein